MISPTARGWRIAAAAPAASRAAQDDDDELKQHRDDRRSRSGGLTPASAPLPRRAQDGGEFAGTRSAQPLRISPAAGRRGVLGGGHEPPPHPRRDPRLAARQPRPAGKREIARAFGLKGADKVALKQLLAEMKREGTLERRRRKRPPAGRAAAGPGAKVTGADRDGDLWAEPAEWEVEAASGRASWSAPAATTPASAPATGCSGGCSTARRASAARRAGHPPHRHGAEAGHRHLPRGRGAAGASPRSTRAPTATGRSPPATAPARARASWSRPSRSARPARYGLPHARVVARLGDPSAPQVGVADRDPRARHPRRVPRGRPLAEAEAAKPVGARHAARICAPCPSSPSTPPTPATTTTRSSPSADDDPANPGGHVVWVAIADVAALRPPGLRARPRGAAARQLDLFPRPGRADAARPAVGRSLLADRRRRPPLHRRPPRPRRRRQQARAPLHPRPDALGRRRSPTRQAQDAADGRPDATTAPLRRDRHPPALGGLEAARKAREVRAAAEPRPAGAADRALGRGQGAVGRLPRALRRAPGDRGLHDPRQRRRRRDAGGEAGAPALPRPRGAEPGEARGAARDRRDRSA